MRASRLLPISLALAGLAGLICVTFAAEPRGNARAVLQAGIDETLGTAFAKPPVEDDAAPLAVRLRPTLEKFFAFDLMTRRAFGPAWKPLAPEQRDRATELFTELLIRTYANRFNGNDRPIITYRPEIGLAPERCEVPTVIAYAGASYAVSYRLEQREDGWRIYDVIIEGVSLVANYRAQFSALYQKGGVAEVLRALEQKHAELNSARKS